MREPRVAVEFIMLPMQTRINWRTTMKHQIALIAMIAMYNLSSCMSYEKLIKSELKIPYVFIPPNNLDLPYSLQQLTKDGNFQRACTASQLTGLSDKELSNQLRFSKTSTLGISEKASTSFNVKVSKEEIGTLDIKYTRISKIRLELKNGQIATLPEVNISNVANNISFTKCRDNVRLLLKERPDSRFYIPVQVYSYDINYQIFLEDGADVTAELSEDLSKVVLAKAGISYKSSKDLTISGNNIYVGFRGTPLIATLPKLLKKRNIADKDSSSVSPLGGANVDNDYVVVDSLFDVTKIVQQVANDSENR